MWWWLFSMLRNCTSRRYALNKSLMLPIAALPVAHLIMHPLDDTAGLDALHPAAGKRMVDGRATVYICRGRTCQAPVTDPGALRTALEAIAGRDDREG